MPGNVKGRLLGEQATSNTNSRASGYNADSNGLAPINELDEIAHHVDGTFVLVVKTAGGRYRRRCFFSAASAEKAARNAQQAGHDATVFLAELRPLWRLAGSAPDLLSAGAR